MPKTCEGQASENQTFGEYYANFTYCSIVNGDWCQSYRSDYTYSFFSENNKSVEFTQKFIPLAEDKQKWNHVGGHTTD